MALLFTCPRLRVAGVALRTAVFVVSTTDSLRREEEEEEEENVQIYITDA